MSATNDTIVVEAPTQSTGLLAHAPVRDTTRTPAAEASGRPPSRSPRRATPRPHAPDFERADRIGEFWRYPESRAFAELLIDCEEDRVVRVVLVGMLREDEKR